MVQIEWDSVEHAQQVEGVPEIGRLLRGLRGVAHQDRNSYCDPRRSPPGWGKLEAASSHCGRRCSIKSHYLHHP